MNKLIQQSLLVNATTIIPNFGAVMKMGKTFMFNEFLKYDDGKLAQVIADHNGIELSEAKNQLSDWVEKLNKDLDGGGTVSFDGVGELTRNDGKIKFVAKPAGNKNEEVKTEPKKEDEKQVEKPISKPEEKAPEKPAAKQTTQDLSAVEAIERINKESNKSELIELTRGESRKTVVEALNKRLDELNGKKPKAEEIKPPKPIIETKVEKVKVEEKIVQKDNKKAEEPLKNPVTAKPEVKKEVEPTKPEIKLEKPVTEQPKEKQPVTEVKKEEPKKEEKPIKEKVKDIPASKETKEEKDKAVAAIVEGVEATEKEGKKRKKMWVLWLGLLLILIGGGVVGFLKKDEIMAMFDKKHEPKELAESEKDEVNNDENPEKNADPSSNTEEETNANASENEINEVITEDNQIEDSAEEENIEDTQIEEEEVVVVVDEKEPVIENTNVSGSSGNWHIVAGSFSSESNANNKVEDLKSQGYSSAKVLGKYNGLYTVRAASYNSKDEAKSALDAFKNAGNKGFIKNL